jgi:hypothetical protein
MNGANGAQPAAHAGVTNGEATMHGTVTGDVPGATWV